MTIEITSRFSDRVLYTSAKGTLKEALEEAVAAEVDLFGANLRGANLRGAHLHGASLNGANLRGANLRGAHLHGADLTDASLIEARLNYANLTKAHLQGASLNGANLRGAHLHGADLTDASLIEAILTCSDLSGANLNGVNLEVANLDPIKHDLFRVLTHAPAEVAGLRKALVAGKVDGSVYEGPCACLLGTIANVRGCHFRNLGELEPNSQRPIERFFLAIQPGQTPENCQFAKLAVEWIDEFVELSSMIGKTEACHRRT